MKSWPDLAVPSIPKEIKIPILSLSDTASGKKKLLDFKPLYRIYVCGITPYDATHLGHAATYLTFDLVNRYLRAQGSEVRYVQNITDIDDPLLERALRDGVDWNELAHQQIDLFRDDMTHLRVIPPTHYIGAVEAIPLVSKAITILFEQNSIYKVDSDLYFSIHSDENFGSRSHLSVNEMTRIFSERGGDPHRFGKKDPLDCLVWMAHRDGEPGWDSPHSYGRPGWHIECTAIAIEYLVPSDFEDALIDIQGGGSDLVFPHHEMCAAQAAVIAGKELATHYVHAGMIGLDGEKMSKSKGNLVFVSQLLAAGRDPMAIRWALMKGHYTKDRMWNEHLLLDAEEEIKALREVLSSHTCAPTNELIQKIVDHLSDDLDTPAVLTLINEWVEQSRKGEKDGDPNLLIQVLDALLGLKI